MLDDADRPTLTDHLDPGGRYRQALRAALVNVLIERPLPTRACDRESVRAPHCTTHAGARR